MKKRGSQYIIIVSILLAMMLGVYAIGFDLGPTISSGDIYTDDNLTCTWTPSADHNGTTNINWYKDGVLTYTDAPAGNTANLFYANTTKDESWLCEVTIYNGTDNITQNSSSITIKNSPPEIPIVYYTNDSVLPINKHIYEDQPYTFKVNSTDADGDILEYSANKEIFCSMSVSSTSGVISCLPTNDDLTNGPHSYRNETVRFYADDNAPIQGTSPYKEITFTVIPVNDQANFTLTPQNVSILSEAYWEFNVSGEDEELDYPLNFTVQSDLNNISEILIVTAVNNTTAKINFSENPTNNFAGIWNVTINLTDVNGTDGGRSPRQYTFELEINSTNHDPFITTNFSEVNISGIQGNNFSLLLQGNDSDSNDTLEWEISAPSNTSDYCTDNFPWNITTTNSSPDNATGFINETLNNTHAACRYVEIILNDDALGSTSQLVMLNITNTNDPPTIHEIGVHGNMSDYVEQTTYVYATYRYQVNATDPDNYTYDAANTANLTYSITNNDNFTINPDTGLITINVLNSSYVGNWSLNISVTDGQLNDSRILELRILNNTAPILNISQNNLEFVQNETEIEINFTSVDTDNHTMSLSYSSLTDFNNTQYDFVSVANNYTNNQNKESWTLNMTRISARERNDLVGFHSIAINISDQLGALLENVSTGTLNFTINNTNDVPFFDQNQDNVSDNVTFGTVVINKTFSKIIYVTDYDLFLDDSVYEEVLTFSYNNESSGISNVSFTKLNESSAMINFTPDSIGMKNITLLVTDTYNESAYRTVEFEVLADSLNPEIQEIKPYFDNALNLTVQSFTNASTLFYPNAKESINTSENTSLVFDAIATNDTSIAGNYLTYYWYVNDELNKSVVDATPGVDSKMQMNFSFFSNGTYNITLVVEDQRLSVDEFTWNLDVADVNRMHYFNNGSMEDLDVNRSSDFEGYFNYRMHPDLGVPTQRFYDPDDDIPDEDGDVDGKIRAENNESPSLNFSVRFPELCSLVDFEIVGDRLSIIPSETGVCFVEFVAEDIYGNQVISDEVRLDIVGAEPSSGVNNPSQQSGGSSTNTQVVTVPIEEEVDVPKPIKLIAPGTVNTYYNRTMQIPITLRNTWESEIRGIRLNLTMADQPNVTYSFENSYFPSMPVGGETTTTLSVSNYRTDGPFDITIHAFVADPEFTDSVSILINSLEQTSDGDQVRTKVTFAKDMLSENPECRELNDLLDRASYVLDSGDVSEARRLVDSVINGCKFLMQDRQENRRESPSIVEKSFDLLDKHSDKILIAAAVLTLVTIVVYIVASLKKLIMDSGK